MPGSSSIIAKVLISSLLLELAVCLPARADEGIPDALLNKGTPEAADNTRHSSKDKSDDDNQKSTPDSSLLEGRADWNFNPHGAMPPVAPPIRRQPTPSPIFSMPPVENAQPILNRQSPQMDEEQKTSRLSALKNMFELGASKDYGPIERPNWIPAHAYTNQNMVAPYHNKDIAWWDKSKMPDRPQWVILSTSVTRFWRGYAANPCWILVAPNALAPGNFTFRSKIPHGPRGWLQDINRTSKFGFPLYRYWLDQPQFR